MGLCKCKGEGCLVHKGKMECFNPIAVRLFRMNIVDGTGIDFCEDCASNALESGVFYEMQD